MRAFNVLILFISFLPFPAHSQNSEEDFHQDDIACKERMRAEAFDEIGHQRNWAADQTNMIYQEIHWELDPAVNYIKGVITYRFLSKINNLHQLVLDMDTTLHISYVRRGNVDLSFEHTDDKLLTIELGHSLSIDDLDSLTVAYEGTPISTGFGSFEIGLHNNKPILWTQSVPYGVRDWWPGKQDLIDKIDSIDVFITTPDDQLAAGNGKLVSITEENGKRIHHWSHRYPIVSYLIAVAITNYESYSEYVTWPNGDSIHILNYVYPESKATAQSQTPVAKEMMKFFVEKFGPYPYAEEKFGHAQFSWGGGTEIQTMNFMTNFSTGLIAHELAHQWFGDKVTCGSYHDTWLNEGFATYLTGLVFERFPTYGSFNNWKTSTRSSATSEDDGSVFVDDTTDFARIFDSRLTYDKGAFVLHMLRWVVGDSSFFKACSSYLNLPHTSYGFGRTRDLQNELELASGKDLDEFFADWYYGEGYPSYTINWTQEADSVTFWVSQQTSHVSVPFFEMPIPIQVSYLGGTQTFVMQHTSQGQKAKFFVGNHNINNVFFDPDKWLLSKNNVIEEVPVGIWKVNPGANILLYPNPAGNKLYVKGDVPVSYAQFINAYGQVDQVPINNDQVNIHAMSQGLYTVILFDDGHEPVLIQRVVISGK